MSGVMMFVVNAVTKALNARAMTSPTAITTKFPCIRKFLNPFSMTSPFD